MMERYCTIQVDLDGLWVVKRLLGLDGAIEPDPVFEIGLDRLLALFGEFGIKATFFVVAEDLKSEAKTRKLKEIADSGHEIASHGMTHRYLNSIPESDRFDEIVSSKKAIEGVFGTKVSGFRAPGFAINKDASAMLLEAGYLYDSSVLGTYLAYLVELFSGLSYPKWAMMTAPASPYISSPDDIFKRGKGGIAEIPVTTLPLLRLPIHFSYAALGGRLYCRFMKTVLKNENPRFVNYLFHPLDLLDGRSIKIDAKVYGLAKDSRTKMSMASDILGFFKDRYHIVTSIKMYEIAKDTF